MHAQILRFRIAFVINQSLHCQASPRFFKDIDQFASFKVSKGAKIRNRNNQVSFFLFFCSSDMTKYKIFASLHRSNPGFVKVE